MTELSTQTGDFTQIGDQQITSGVTVSVDVTAAGVSLVGHPGGRDARARVEARWRLKPASVGCEARYRPRINTRYTTSENEKGSLKGLPFFCLKFPKCSHFVPNSQIGGKNSFENRHLHGADEETRTLTACAAGVGSQAMPFAWASEATASFPRTVRATFTAYSSPVKHFIKSDAVQTIWCGRWDSNPHTSRRGYLKPVCLPFHHFRIVARRPPPDGCAYYTSAGL